MKILITIGLTLTTLCSMASELSCSTLNAAGTGLTTVTKSVDCASQGASTMAQNVQIVVLSGKEEITVDAACRSNNGKNQLSITQVDHIGSDGSWNRLSVNGYPNKNFTYYFSLPDQKNPSRVTCDTKN